MLWCMAPIPHNGSDMIYNKIIKVFFLKHEASLDDAISSLNQTADEGNLISFYFLHKIFYTFM